MDIGAVRRELAPGGKLPMLDGLAGRCSAADLRARLAARYPAFAACPTEIAIIGAAEEGLRLAGLCAQQGIRIGALVDDNPSKLGQVVQGLAVTPTSRLEELDPAVPIVIASHRVLKATQRLRRMGFANVAPFAVLQLLHPSEFPPHMFYDGLLEDLATNADRYAALAARLADEKSRRVLDAVLGYRSSLDPELLEPVIDWDLYDPSGLFALGPDEIYVDAGAFDGDSIRSFIGRVDGRYERIIGFEPDRATYDRLTGNFRGEPRIELINAGLHHSRGSLRFDNAGSRGSLLVQTGGVDVPVVALDDVLGGGRASLIKMNIEGAELDALEGARKTIERWRPRLIISAYHRPSDLWRVPEAILNIAADYRLFLRQHDGGVIESVIYALPLD